MLPSELILLLCSFGLCTQLRFASGFGYIDGMADHYLPEPDQDYSLEESVHCEEDSEEPSMPCGYTNSLSRECLDQSPPFAFVDNKTSVYPGLAFTAHSGDVNVPAVLPATTLPTTPKTEESTTAISTLIAPTTEADLKKIRKYLIRIRKITPSRSTGRSKAGSLTSSTTASSLLRLASTPATFIHIKVAVKTNESAPGSTQIDADTTSSPKPSPISTSTPEPLSLTQQLAEPFLVKTVDRSANASDEIRIVHSKSTKSVSKVVDGKSKISDHPSVTSNASRTTAEPQKTETKHRNSYIPPNARNRVVLPLPFTPSDHYVRPVVPRPHPIPRSRSSLRPRPRSPSHSHSGPSSCSGSGSGLIYEAAAFRPTCRGPYADMDPYDRYGQPMPHKSSIAQPHTIYWNKIIKSPHTTTKQPVIIHRYRVRSSSEGARKNCRRRFRPQYNSAESESMEFGYHKAPKHDEASSFPIPYSPNNFQIYH